jgi:hypothetical protein
MPPARSSFPCHGHADTSVHALHCVGRRVDAGGGQLPRIVVAVTAQFNLEAAFRWLCDLESREDTGERRGGAVSNRHATVVPSRVG